MPLITSPEFGKSASFTLYGDDWTPTGDEWARATAARKRDYWQRLGELAIVAKQNELRKGIDVRGKALTPVNQAYRRDKATGPPLTPHRAESRFWYRMRVSLRSDGVTVYWGDNWAKVVQAHRIGATIKNGFGRGIKIKLPERDVVGLTPRSQAWLHDRISHYWGNAAIKYSGQRERYRATLREKAKPQMLGPVLIPVSPNAAIVPPGAAKPPGFWRRVLNWFTETASKIFNRRGKP